MNTRDSYQAAWAPGLDTDADPDDSLELELDWIEALDVPGEPATTFPTLKPCFTSAISTCPGPVCQGEVRHLRYPII